MLHPLAGGEGTEDLTLWVKADNLVLQHMVSSPKFAERLSMELLEARLDQFARGKLIIEAGAPPKGIQAPTILPGTLLLSFGKYVKPKAPELAKAWLHLVEGSGNALTPDLELDPGEETNKVWHIGRGLLHRGSQSVRRNAFVVNDGDPKGESGAVSHAHCDVVYQKGAFYLQACTGGCRAEGGSATKILENGTDKLTELHSTSLLYPLHPGDMIELSKTVLILFDRK